MRKCVCVLQEKERGGGARESARGEEKSSSSKERWTATPVINEHALIEWRLN